MKSTRSGVYVIIAVAALILCVVVFSRRAAVEAVYPLERASLIFRRSVWTRVKGVFNGPGYAAENIRLRREVSALSMLSEEIERVERENAALRRSLGYAERVPGKWMAAPVLADHCGSSLRHKAIRVGRGALDGVMENAVVASPDGLVGLVTMVSEHASEVTLITDRTLQAVCTVELGNGRFASGILEGGDAEGLALTHIRGLSSDIPQARVVTSRRGGVFPEGLAVGRLIQASATESGEWRGSVLPAVDFDRLEDVFIRCER